MSAGESGTLNTSSSLISISPWIPNGIGSNRVPPIQKDVVLSTPVTGEKLGTGVPLGSSESQWLPFK
jgi:hypothetical protein